MELMKEIKLTRLSESEWKVTIRFFLGKLCVCMRMDDFWNLKLKGMKSYFHHRCRFEKKTKIETKLSKKRICKQHDVAHKYHSGMQNLGSTWWRFTGEGGEPERGRYGISRRVLNSMAHDERSERVMRCRIEHEKKNFISITNHELLCLSYKHSSPLLTRKVHFVTGWKWKDRHSN